MFHTIDEAIFDLKAGKPIIVVDNEDRENEGDLVALSENVTPEMINFMITHGKGLVCAPITAEAAERLDLPLMTGKNSDPFETAFTVSIDHMETTTGISAEERARTIQALIDPDTKAADFKQPGHVFPLIAKEGGVLTRPGHTEASVDLANLCGVSASAVICEIIKEDGTMARVPELQEMAVEFDLKIITIESLITYRKQHETHIKREVETSLPTDYGVFNVYGYSNDLDQKEHLAFVK
ncbi:MAG TPA: 3,4-dihydroxy-2-butanone-4-phosphate synthase, partial [Virgibacillus sp.]|nr:3,4-dihydroxy-2-butanone-4-phosphate synthase [Virgibacillus sp.]